MISKTQLRNLIDWTLKEIDMYSPAASNLIQGTIAQESRGGHFIKQLGTGPAMGIIQMEPATEKDIWENYLEYRPEIITKIQELTGVFQSGTMQLQGDMIYQIIMARLQYKRDSKPLPAHDDIPSLARYWKRVYNTPLGRGTVREFINNYTKYVT